MIKIRVFHTGRVCVSPALPFGGSEKNPLKMSPIIAVNSPSLRTEEVCGVKTSEY